MRKQLQRRGAFRAIAVGLALWQSLPLQVLAEPAGRGGVSTPPAKTVPAAAPKAAPAPAPPVRVNRTVPKVKPVPEYPLFSEHPSEQELFRARVFAEPLVPVGGRPNDDENRALADAVTAYLRSGDNESLKPFESFLGQHPDTPWKASLLTNLATVCRRAGYFSRALDLWRQAWDLSKESSETYGRAVADHAVGELMDTNLMFGRAPELRRISDEVGERDVRGTADQRVQAAREGLWILENKHDEAVPSGPLALDRIQALRDRNYQGNAQLDAFHATQDGATLAQIEELANGTGMKMQAAYREKDAGVIVPAVLHWKLGHFSALLKVDEQSGRYLVMDPMLGREIWLTRAVLNAETTGYYLVPQGSLPVGWRAASAEEVRNVRGKCGPKAPPKPNENNPNGPQSGGNGSNCQGMATYSFQTLIASLRFQDAPVGYTPPRGPAVQFLLTYHQREQNQPQIFYYGNFGPKWTFDFVSYVEDSPGNPAQPAGVYLRGGGRETYVGVGDGVESEPHYYSRAMLVRTSTAPVQYERHLPDGSIEVFGQPDGATTFPRRIFMTESVDPQGNRLRFTYDSQLRLVAIEDALGQVTTLAYELTADPLRITKVTDPFGRSASFDYDDNGRLVRITDVIGITSEFQYGTGDFIVALTTPYGTTTFRKNEYQTYWRSLEATDPLGGTEHLEYRYTTPEVPASEPVPQGISGSQSLRSSNSFFWDKRAQALAPGDFSKARVTRWLYNPQLGQVDMIPHSTKQPLEGRVWYEYAATTQASSIGSSANPTKVARLLDDGSSQVRRFEYNSKGRVTRATDPVGRETVYQYDTNEADLLAVRQRSLAAAGGYDLLASFTYNARHQRLTAMDASGLTTTYAYDLLGHMIALTTPARAGMVENRTTTYSYGPDGSLLSIAGPGVGTTTAYSYDSYGRVRTATDADGYAVTTDYDSLDRPTRTTYSDGTYEEIAYSRLDAERRRDRAGRWTHTFYDPLRRVVASRDALGRTVGQEWCKCGSLDKLVNGNGKPTTWERDIQGRVTREILPNSATTEFTYEGATSRLKAVKDPKLQIKTFDYNLDNTIRRVAYTNAENPTPEVTFAYDFHYRRLVTMTDAFGTTTYGYRPVTSPATLGAGGLETVDGALLDDTITHSYDERGRPVTSAIGSMTSTRTYDELGRLQTNATTLGTFSFGYSGGSNRLSSVTLPNGQTSLYSYFDNSGERRLREIKHQSSTAAVLANLSYTYDLSGRIRSVTQQVGAGGARVYEYAYDAADQVTSAIGWTTDAPPAPLKRYAYAYDAAANRASEQIDNLSVAATYDEADRLLSLQPGGAVRVTGSVSEPATVTVQGRAVPVSADDTFAGQAVVGSGSSNIAVVATDSSGNTRTNSYQVAQSGATTTYTYDANGNAIAKVTAGDAWGYSWDAANRLIRVSRNGTELARFAYDGLGRRVQRTAGGSTRTYVYDDEDVVQERENGVTILSHVNGTGTDWRLATQDQAGQVSFPLTDHLGSVVAIAGNNQQIVQVHEYDPFGGTTGAALQEGRAFTGREWDPAIGLYYYRARWYDPGAARFLSADPAGLMGGSNRYAYVENNPVSYGDPFGLAKTARWIQGPQDSFSFTPDGEMDVGDEWTLIPAIGIIGEWFLASGTFSGTVECSDDCPDGSKKTRIVPVSLTASKRIGIGIGATTLWPIQTMRRGTKLIKTANQVRDLFFNKWKNGIRPLLANPMLFCEPFATMLEELRKRIFEGPPAPTPNPQPAPPPGPSP